ncbi:hypothetical protein C4D60_Mb09t00730 [Musa balbisiana]|uniref:Transcription factor CBF/NF-Y/archaeal histone domain-containing protein n=1 Tax=Musa balbisiana TaxID=52838 RepID=A0A4V4H2W9_MUSBA|nr:hypothetical protein C4D60_Mb09t00730 [Musa balbisiana]
MEPMDIVGKSKEDVSLPKSTMFKIIKEMLPPDVRVARDTQDLLVECCVEFINLVSSESNEVCNREDKKTIAPEHVLKALENEQWSEHAKAAGLRSQPGEPMMEPRAFAIGKAASKCCTMGSLGRTQSAIRDVSFPIQQNRRRSIYGCMIKSVSNNMTKRSATTDS